MVGKTESSHGSVMSSAIGIFRHYVHVSFKEVSSSFQLPFPISCTAGSTRAYVPSWTFVMKRIGEADEGGLGGVDCL